MNKLVTWCAAIAGLILLLLTAVYWLEPAGALPAFFPGFEPGSTHVHFKHGLATLLLALALFAWAWFQSGPRGGAGGPDTSEL